MTESVQQIALRPKPTNSSPSTPLSRLFKCSRTVPLSKSEYHDSSRGALDEHLEIQPPPAYPGDATSRPPFTEPKPTLEDSSSDLQPSRASPSTNDPQPTAPDIKLDIEDPSKPVVIPRLNPGSTFPFARAWAPELERHDIPQSDWLGFLDRLNILSSPHPGITAAQVLGVGLAFAPFEGADGLAFLIELGAAGLAAHMAKTKCRDFLAQMNRDYFGPRGLHVRIVDGKELRRNLGLETKDPMMAPLGEETLDMTTQERCLAYLNGRVCELDFDVPDPDPQTKALARLAAWRVKLHVKDTDKKATKARRKAWKRFQKGKKLKECREEKSRVKRISWVLLQSIEDFERDKILVEEEKKVRKQSTSERRGLLSARTLRNIKLLR
ncbi:hypothetical protein CkaCkLH20_10922 [Colletotrichum karsti]|uniref:Uncharacterized protein n=1 Tax=Colletotrichum karsti TaxID=1095194 RepID=A0A9P6HYL6_9PEZI|nr:uncharacterized protein CkaCkLH20_10922 [Colletotrichum karsti]KAF9871511.1 hypothetical protein CkaCkLH20_10922 [Colletotrichum karsti]